MSMKKKTLYRGIGSLICFLIVLGLIFVPFFKEGNTLNLLDNLYNSISKGSAYYIPDIIKKNEKFQGHEIDVKLIMRSSEQVEKSAILLRKSGAEVEASELDISIRGDLGQILSNCLADADIMFHNKGDELVQKYGYAEKPVMYNWWTVLNLMDFALKKQKQFKDADFVTAVKQKAVETAYNYYTIEPQNIMDKAGIVLFSLIFYVVYTLWFGFSILFLFEGWGMAFDH